MRDADIPLYFALFNEIGILSQLSRTVLEARLPEGLLVSHFGVLNHLIRVQDGQTPLRLARAFQVPKTSMTHTLAGLEKRALIEMRVNPEDARSKCVWITEAGRDVRDRAIRDISADMEAMVGEFAPDRVARLVPELAELRKILDAARD
ncbi:MarR family winged helix-turn-helix transcriptional regulator [Pseudaestuariivita atlantica]|uniref:MarR family transcriptional regulator n=1 Tax=Pseudaestuariivita atlantica TaxID=1317121 RepID=A0A0L1JTW8_9RHOB|nr:MarR family transcriptional regulator [Pseudaestuariivita atlantica]KNG95219.1 MarR family transcriptional regulator [Pseudaestuariivita atlantica]